MLVLKKKPQLAGSASRDRNPEVRSLGGEAMAEMSATGATGKTLSSCILSITTLLVQETWPMCEGTEGMQSLGIEAKGFAACLPFMISDM
jgi:hypothetical protein